MADDVDDKRALFVRVVDDIVDQIRTRKLQGGDVLPTARKLAEAYGVASMTAQRALRELQQRGLTYAVVGKGTFVHPKAATRLDRDAAGSPTRPDSTWLVLDDPDLNQRAALYLLHLNQVTSRIVDAMMAKDTAALNAAVNELAVLKEANSDLGEEIASYEASSGLSSPTSEPAGDRPTRSRRGRSAST
jgi:DNA-binding transcriptional regulator YhcF (GntR family)